MKNLITTCFYLTLTSGVIAAVFYLPSVLFSYEDQQLFAKVEQSEIESMEFTYSYSLFDTINLLSSGYYTVEYPSNGGSRSADEIYRLASDAFQQLMHYGKKYGIRFLNAKDKIMDHDTALQLAISSSYETGLSDTSPDETTEIEGDASGSGQSVSADNTHSTDITSAAIWQCHLYSEYGYWIEFCIDDKSGKIVNMFLWHDPEVSQQDACNTDTLIDLFRAFFKAYYGLPVKITPMDKNLTSDTKTNASTYGDHDYDQTLIVKFIIQLTDEFGNSASMTLKITPEHIILSLSN